MSLTFCFVFVFVWLFVCLFLWVKFNRLVWAAIILTADAYLIANIFFGFVKYYDRAVNTLVSVTYASPNQLDFPAVTLCNYNQWRKSKATQGELGLIEAIYGSQGKGIYSWFGYLEHTHRLKDTQIGCVEVKYLTLTTSRFWVIWARNCYFEARLIVLLQ